MTAMKAEIVLNPISTDNPLLKWPEGIAIPSGLSFYRIVYSAVKQKFPGITPTDSVSIAEPALV